MMYELINFERGERRLESRGKIYIFRIIERHARAVLRNCKILMNFYYAREQLLFEYTSNN